MKKQFRVTRLAGALAVLLATTTPAFAQTTSAGVTGRVTSEAGAPLAGADVIIVHTPTGTTSRATTDESGRYNARGLRVGGPYTVTVMREGYQGESSENVYLLLGEAVAVNVDLATASTQLDAIEVIGTSAATLFSPDKMGTGTNVTSEQIEALPSSGRNIQDFIRLDPRIAQISKSDGAISAGGQNSRYNVIRIDGVSTNDPFGLEANNLPTERQPVSLDAIEEISIDLANYDTTVAGGTGAVVNAVTKSGGNDFSGSAYYFLRDGDWVGDGAEDQEFNGFTSEETYGGTFGGPILQDRLFFFANYEKFVRDAPGVGLGGTPFGDGDITAADIALAQQIAQGYGLTPGELNPPANSKTEIEEYAVKLDWNINEDHRASFRYSQLEQSVLRLPGITTSSISLSSHWYNQVKEFDTAVLEVFSNWSDTFSTEFKVSQRDYLSDSPTFGSQPSIQVEINNNDLRFGTERNRHVNVVETEQLNLFGAGNLYLGDHSIKFGFDHENNDVLNFYGRDLFGHWEFDSLEDFAAGRPSLYQLRTPRPGGSLADIPAQYEFSNTGIFLQDSWAVSYNLNLMFGLRVDIPEFGDDPIYNPRIEEIFGLDNTNTVDKELFQPRFGFNYTFDTLRSTQLRGGLGLFQGASPNVWLAGAFQNTGLNFDAYSLRGDNAPDFDPTVPPAVPGAGAGTPQIVADIMEPGLALPSVWKANLAFDHELPWGGLIASAELLMTKNKDALWFDRLDVGAPTYIGQDGREIFWNAAGLNPDNAGRFGISNGSNGAGNRANRPEGVDQAIVIRNTSKGASQQLTLSVAKPMTENWAWTAGYTYTHATEFSPATSSQNSSNWGNTLVGENNAPVGYDSRYAIKDRFTGGLTYQNTFFGDNQTSVSMFYEGRSGRKFSYIYFNDVNGDSANTNDLLYVPSGPGDVLFTGNDDQTPAQMEAAFFDFLEQNPELLQYAGQIAPANAFEAGWVHNFDVRLSQEIPSFFEGHKFELTLDLLNVGNMINKDWGVIEDYGFFSTRRTVNYAGIDPETGRYVYNYTGNPDNESIIENNNDKGNTGVSRWSVMLGLRYRF